MCEDFGNLLAWIIVDSKDKEHFVRYLDNFYLAGKADTDDFPEFI